MVAATSTASPSSSPRRAVNSSPMVNRACLSARESPPTSMVGGLFVWWFQLNGGWATWACGPTVWGNQTDWGGACMIDSKGNVRPGACLTGRIWLPKPSAHTIRRSSACSTGRRVARFRRVRAWIRSRRSYSFTLSDVTHRTVCAAPGYIAPEVLNSWG